MAARALNELKLLLTKVVNCTRFAITAAHSYQNVSQKHLKTLCILIRKHTKMTD